MDALKAEQARVQRELGQAKSLIGQYQQDYQALEAALDHALLLCRNGALSYEYAEPEVRRQLIQAASDKLWVVGAGIAGADLKPGYVTLLDEELVTVLEQKTAASGSGQLKESWGGPDSGTTYYRDAGSFGLDVAALD